MRMLDRLMLFLKGEPGLFDSFERDLIERLTKALNLANAEIFQDQMGRFNKVRRTPDGGNVSRVETNMYWKEWGKIRRDFPKRFLCSEREKKLATLVVDSSIGEINVEFWLVDGAMFSMEFSSPQQVFRPLDPSYVVKSIKIHVPNE